MEGSPGIDPQVIGEVEAEALSRQVIREIASDALKQQARLSLTHPVPKEPHGLRRWLHRA